MQTLPNVIIKFILWLAMKSPYETATAGELKTRKKTRKRTLHNMSFGYSYHLKQYPRFRMIVSVAERKTNGFFHKHRMGERINIISPNRYSNVPYESLRFLSACDWKIYYLGYTFGKKTETPPNVITLLTKEGKRSLTNEDLTANGFDYIFIKGGSSHNLSTYRTFSIYINTILFSEYIIYLKQGTIEHR